MFFLFSGYAIIRNSNINRYRSTLILFFILALDILIILRDWICDLAPLFYPEQWILPIPLNLNLLFITMILFGVFFGLFRKMLVFNNEPLLVP